MIVKMKSCLESAFYDEINPDGVKSLFTAVLFIPFALMGKALKTVFKAAAVLFGLVALLPTFGRVSNRNFFVECVSSFAKDLADWVVFPFAFSRYLFRCLFRKQRV